MQDLGSIPGLDADLAKDHMAIASDYYKQAGNYRDAATRAWKTREFVEKNNAPQQSLVKSSLLALQTNPSDNSTDKKPDSANSRDRSKPE